MRFGCRKERSEPVTTSQPANVQVDAGISLRLPSLRPAPPPAPAPVSRLREVFPRRRVGKSEFIQTAGSFPDSLPSTGPENKGA